MFGWCFSVLLALYQQLPPKEGQEPSDRVMVVMSSDRGLCGGIHSSLVKAVRAELAETQDNCHLLILGDKARQILQVCTFFMSRIAGLLIC